MRETGKSIAQVARDLGIHEGTLGNWVAKDRAERDGTQGLSVDDAAELKTATGRKRRAADGARCFKTLGGPVGEGGDEMSVARFIADQRTMHGVPHAVCCAILAVSVSWFYKWLHREPTNQGRSAAVS